MRGRGREGQGENERKRVRGVWVVRGGKGVAAYLGGSQGITQDFKMMMKMKQEKGGGC